MHQVVLFIEPLDATFYDPFKAGHLFINRFTIDEEAKMEILKILELGKSSVEMIFTKDPEHVKKVQDQKGTDLISANIKMSIQSRTLRSHY